MDTLANMLSTIKNASMIQKPFVELPYSGIKEEVLGVLKEKGFIENVKVFKLADKGFKMLHVDLKYDNGGRAITEIKRVSKPGRRIYKTKDGLKTIRGGFGISIVTTSKGVMDSRDAKRKRLGGEVICLVY